MSDSVWILGASMTRFARHADRDLLDLASEAALGALEDGGVSVQDLDVLACGSLFAANAGVGQQLLGQIGQTGISVYNVANACATGATAVRVGVMAIRSGEASMALAVGAEKMGKMGLLGGSRGPAEPPKVFEPEGRFGSVRSVEGILGTKTMPGVFAQAGMRYAHDHPDVGFEQFAKVAHKNHQHSTLNPLAQYRKEFSLDEIKASPMVAYPNTLLMCCPTGDGAAAAVLVGGERMRTLSADQRRRAVKLSASVLTSDPYVEGGQAQPDVNTLTRNAACAAYEQAGVAPEDLDLVELHDCFASAELLHYDNLGLCAPGGAGDFIDSGAPYRHGALPVNVSGGLISKGHPIGATGVANIYEVAAHLRGEAGERQIPDARVGLAHVIGLGSSCCVHILERSAA
ncbi:MAG: thiolase family protein [bacterium]|nr:thiolase family protein [bacterium]